MQLHNITQLLMSMYQENTTDKFLIQTFII